MSFPGCFDPVHHATDEAGRWVYGCSRCGMCYGCAHFTIEDRGGRRYWRCGDGRLRPVIRDTGASVEDNGVRAREDDRRDAIDDAIEALRAGMPRRR